MVATARHYIPDLVYGGNDGIITSCAVVSGATGSRIIVIAATLA